MIRTGKQIHKVDSCITDPQHRNSSLALSWLVFSNLLKTNTHFFYITRAFSSVIAQHPAIQTRTRRYRPSGSTSWREESAAKKTRRTRRRERRKRRKKIIKKFDLGNCLFVIFLGFILTQSKIQLNSQMT